MAAGWQRQPVLGDNLWDGPWPCAIQELTKMAIKIIHDICDKFNRGIPGSPYGFEPLGYYREIEWTEDSVYWFLMTKLDSWIPKPGHEGLNGWLRHFIQGTPGILQKVKGFFFINSHFSKESRISCRKNAEINYRLEVQAHRYLDLYASQINLESRRRVS